MTSSGTPHFGIRDNHSRGKVADFLSAKIAPDSQLSIVSAYFTIYAYQALSHELGQIEHLDFLFGEPRFIASLDPEKTDKKAFRIEDDGLELANRLQQKEVAHRCAEWIRAKVTDDSWGKMEAVEAIDRVLKMTERVLNPASHGNSAPLYEEEVRRAKRLIDRLEKVLAS